MKYFISCLTSKRADCYSRARRKEYWSYTMLMVLAVVILALIGICVFIATGVDFVKFDEATTQFKYANVPIGIWAVILYFIQMITAVPSLAVSVRRLHDIDKSGWWVLISWIPLIGGIWLFVLYLIPGTAGPNKYGEDPKVSESTEQYKSDFQCFNTCLTKYGAFEGESNMQEYWSFTLLVSEVIGFGGALGGLLDVIFKNSASVCELVFVCLLFLAVLLPGLAATARRLRSAGYSPWWLLIDLIPIIGWIWLFVLCLLPDKEPQEGLI